MAVISPGFPECCPHVGHLLTSLRVLTHPSPTSSHLLLRKLGSREFQKLAQRHTTKKWLRWGFASDEFPRGAVTNYHKLGGFKIETHPLTVLEARSPESRGHRATLSLTAPRWALLASSRLWWLLAGLVFLGLCTHHPVSASVIARPCLCASPPLSLSCQSLDSGPP